MTRNQPTSAAAGLVCLLLLAAPAAAAERPIVIRGGTVYPISGAPLPNGTVLIRDGKIAAVGADLPVPRRATIIDAAGGAVMPGMIDLHSHLGLYSYPEARANADGNESTDPITPHMRAIDAFHLHDPALAESLRGGVTTVIARPGSGNIIGGLSVLIKLRPDPTTIEDLLIRAPGDMKMVLEWNPILSYGRRDRQPATRMDVYALARQALQEARDYQEKWTEYVAKRATGEEATPPARDLKLEALALILDRKLPVHIHTSRADEVMGALRLMDEFNLDANLGHAEWGYLVPEPIKERDVVAVIGPRLFRPDPVDMAWKNIPAILDQAGVRVALNTDHPIVQQNHMLYQAGLAVRYGMDEAAALAAVTLVPAQAIRIDDRVGSLEPGKDADVVVLDGDPLEVTTRVLQVFIDGQSVYTYQEPEA